MNSKNNNLIKQLTKKTIFQQMEGPKKRRFFVKQNFCFMKKTYFSKINFSFDKKKRKFDHKIICFDQKTIFFDRITPIFDQKQNWPKKN